MRNLLHCECWKLKRSRMLLIGLLGTLIVPFFVLVRAVVSCASHAQESVSLFALYDNALMFLMLLFGPLVLTILGSWVFSREYSDGTLKNILVIPVSHRAFLAGKFLFFALLATAFMLLSWLEILLLAIACLPFFPVTELSLLSLLFFLGRMLWGGLLLCAVETPFLYLTVRTKGFAAPLVAVTAVSLVNVVLSGSSVAGFFPWAASYLFATGRLSQLGCPAEAAGLLILIVCLAGIAASIKRFQSQELL